MSPLLAMVPSRRLLLPALALLGVLATPHAAAAPRRALALTHLALDLPGAPAAVVPADVDGDGLRDLAVVVAITDWREIGIEEVTELDEVEGLVEVLTVVPALLDRRELWVFRGRPEGGFEAAGRSLTLPPTVLSLAAGPPRTPLVALTDEGVSAVRLDAAGELVLEPLIADPPVLAGSGNFVPDLGLSADLDGDGAADLLLPARDGIAVYPSRDGALAARPAARLALPEDERLPGDARRYRAGPQRHYPLPVVGDADGDGVADLLVRNHHWGWNRFSLLAGRGGGRFSRPVAPLGERSPEAKPEVVFVGDLDGDGRAEVVTAEELTGEGGSLRQELAEAKRPRHALRVHRLRDDLTLDPRPLQSFEVEGYAFADGDGDGNGDMSLPAGFKDLNGDGRLDLVAITLDFSMLQAVKVMTVRRIGLGLDFHVWCQGPDGAFRQVRGLDLSGRFRLDLDDLSLGQLSLFAGDFDGDGRADFVQAGRGERVTIHRGREDCSYPATPDLTIELEEAPRDLALVAVRDLDGDGRADLVVTQPRRREAGMTTSPVRLDLYLSGGGG